MEWWMDSMEWGMDSVLFQMDSIPFPDGFHTFSIWNSGGISSWNDKSTLMP